MDILQGMQMWYADIATGLRYWRAHMPQGSCVCCFLPPLTCMQVAAHENNPEFSAYRSSLIACERSGRVPGILCMHLALGIATPITILPQTKQLACMQATIFKLKL